MRVIRFRGKRLTDGRWVYGDLKSGSQKENFAIHTYDMNGWYNRGYMVDPTTVGQFTGLHDKNGNEIYEGDIIRHKDMVKPYHVIYDGHQFTPNDGFRSLSYPKHWEVIGNIHDNPELLKGGK